MWSSKFRVLLAAVLVFGAACSSDTTGPSVDESTAPAPLLGSLLDGTGELLNETTSTVLETTTGVVQLLTCSSEPYAIATKRIGAAGGTITVGRHTLVVPAGALNRTVTITAERMPGRANSVRFGPEGLEFQRPAQLTLSYSNCVSLPLPKRVVYTDERLSILELILSRDAARSKTVTGSIDHFSRYAVAY
ncbi:MAG TPA: hypothetical protein VFT04_09730 [Gemmatimonadales bacterium]|nr:hypothetical protein [Gemmatimonadales bacterium]